VDTLLESLPAIALGLFLALRGGRRAQGWGLPRVTAYLLVGILLGPHLLGRLVPPDSPGAFLLIGPAAHEVLGWTKRLALGFILFRVGSEFRFAQLRRVGPRILLLSICEVGTCAALVSATVLLVTGDAPLAMVAGLMATSSAPSATLLTLREVEADGPASHALIQLVGLNNLVTLLAFPLVLVVAFDVGQPLVATRTALLALAGGAALGVGMAISLETLKLERERAVGGIVLVLAALGLAQFIDAGSTSSAMLACLAAGIAVSNGSHYSEQMSVAVDAGVYPLYVLFFLGAGSELELGVLADMGVLGVCFVAARAGGKLLGTHVGLRLGRWEGELPSTLGAGLLCQAGVALGLIAALEGQLGERTAGLTTVVLGSVVLFEIFGPILTRDVAVRAGEVKLANLVLTGGTGGARAVREVAGELGQNLGVVDLGRLEAGGALEVRHAMHRAPGTARANLTFDGVLKILGEVGSDLLPVVDESEALVGVISFSETKDILYDPSLRDLVIAEDLAQPVCEPLVPNLSLQEALRRMDAMHVHSWPVVEDGRLVGMLKRRDVYSTLHRAFASGAVGGVTEGQSS
jgi:Kef-type K+ transport system membrane component KefB/CBS domain-containing protein